MICEIGKWRHVVKVKEAHALNNAFFMPPVGLTDPGISAEPSAA